MTTALFVTGLTGGIVSRALAQEEEPLDERERAMNAYVLLAEKKREAQLSPSVSSPETVKELKGYQKELLRFPQKDRFKFGQDTHYTYDTNISRLQIQREEGDSVFKINPFAQVNLSGQKTDLRFEYRWDRVYNAKIPASDTFNQEGTVRFARKILPKTDLSLNSRLNRSSVRSAGNDNKKIGWDNAHRTTFNYEYNPKLNLNFETNYLRTDFPDEKFDETSNYSFYLDPNFSLKLTSKSKMTLGYRWNFTRIPTESSDATTHEFRTGYSGRLTPKSTVSADFVYSLEDPDSAQASRSDQVRSSLGYVWQATKKTSLRTLYSNSFKHSLSDSVSGSNLLKKTTRTASDTLSFSVRVKLHRKLSTEFSFNGSHSRTKTRETGADNTRSRTFTFPFQLAFDIDLAKWFRLRLAYTYRHRIGNEHKTDQHRAHTWFVGCNVAV